MKDAEKALKDDVEKHHGYHLKSGSIRMNRDCLSCSGVPSHTMKMFKMACISYRPSPVTYRRNNLSRHKLLGMRKTLIDKCEEVINGEQWPGVTRDLRTGRIFRDLLQFYGTCDQSQFSAGLTGIPSIQNVTLNPAGFQHHISHKTVNPTNDNTSIQDHSSTEF